MPKLTLEEADLKDLVIRSQEGDTDAFGKIYNHYFESVYRFTAFRVPTEMAEDLVADIFVKAWEKIHTYKVQQNVPFGAWLFRIARHSLIDVYRSQQITEEVPEDIEDEDVLNRAETLVKRKHLLKMVRGAMDELPRRYQEVLQLSYIAELPSDEVARVLKMRSGAARTLKCRALKKLEELLPPDIQENL